MNRLAEVKTLWVNGAIVLFLAAAGLAVSWALLSGAIGLALEIFGYSSERVGWWVAFFGPVWAPLAFGSLLQAIPRSMMDSVWTAGYRRS